MAFFLFLEIFTRQYGRNATLSLRVIAKTFPHPHSHLRELINVFMFWILLDSFLRVNYYSDMFRPYQQTALHEIFASLSKGENPLLHLDTGAGKTMIFCEVLKRIHA